MISTCKAITKLGYRCKKSKIKSSNFCNIHSCKSNFHFSDGLHHQQLIEPPKNKRETKVLQLLKKNHLLDQFNFLKQLDPRIQMGLKAYTFEFWSINSKLDKAVKKSLKINTTDASDINRSKGVLNPLEKIIFKCLMFAFINIPPLSHSIKVFRGVQLSNFSELLLSTNSFTSTTLVSPIKHPWTYLKSILVDNTTSNITKDLFCCTMAISVPKHQKVLPLMLDLNNVVLNNSEFLGTEILLPPLTQFEPIGGQYVVESKFKNSYNKKFFDQLQYQDFNSHQKSLPSLSKKFIPSEDELNTLDLLLTKFDDGFNGTGDITTLLSLETRESKLKYVEDLGIKFNIKVNPEHFLKSIDFDSVRLFV